MGNYTQNACLVGCTSCASREQREINKQKMKLPQIYYLSLRTETPAKGYWDQYILSDILDGFNEVTRLDNLEECIVIIPGAYQFHLIDEINRELAKVKKIKVIITSDEENKFPLHEIKHPNMTLYATYPQENVVNGVRYLPIGYPPHIELKSEIAPEKTLDMFYAGQVNHKDREEMIEKIKGMEVWGEIHPTAGFSQGLNRKEYIEKMSQAKVVPCPKGNISPDSFRLYEALECGAIPVAQYPDFWYKIFKDYPFPVVSKADQWVGYIEDAIKAYPKMNNKIQAWWIREKQRIRKELRGEDEITILVPVSPIPSHPSTEILEQTLDSIRYHTQDEIILLFDGVRSEQKHREKDYDEFIRQVLWKNRKWKNIRPIIFQEHLHQIGMLRKVIDEIKTPLVMFVEQDTPIVIDEPIEWDKIKRFILSGQSNLVRFYHEAFIHPDHKHLMLETKDIFTETAQWSSRPHIASTAFYTRILRDYFSQKARCFTEDVLHGKAFEDFNRFGRQGWEQWKLHLYNPGGNIKRSLHSDGRAGSPKLDNTQIW